MLTVLIALTLQVAPATSPSRAMPVERARALMGTVVRVEAFHADAEVAGSALDAALDEMARVEGLLSTWRDDTEMSAVNRAAPSAPVVVSGEMLDVLAGALDLARATGGTFDPTIGALVTAHDMRGSGRIPTRGELARARRSVGHRHVVVDAEARAVRFESAPEMWIDTGGFGKGYALDRAAAVLRNAGVANALIDFGGQLMALGAPPDEPGWLVAIADPGARDAPATTLLLRDESASTSSQSEHVVKVGGRSLGHVLDPRTGKSVAWPGSATVVADTGFEADALSTALLVLGPKKGPRLARDFRNVECAFIAPGGRVVAGTGSLAPPIQRNSSLGR